MHCANGRCDSRSASAVTLPGLPTPRRAARRRRSV